MFGIAWVETTRDGVKSDFSSDLFTPFLTIIGGGGAQPMIGGGARALADIKLRLCK